jgi:hypothetical protein
MEGELKSVNKIELLAECNFDFDPTILVNHENVHYKLLPCSGYYGDDLYNKKRTLMRMNTIHPDGSEIECGHIDLSPDVSKIMLDEFEKIVGCRPTIENAAHIYDDVANIYLLILCDHKYSMYYTIFMDHKEPIKKPKLLSMLKTDSTFQTGDDGTNVYLCRDGSFLVDNRGDVQSIVVINVKTEADEEEADEEEGEEEDDEDEEGGYEEDDEEEEDEEEDGGYEEDEEEEDKKEDVEVTWTKREMRTPALRSGVFLPHFLRTKDLDSRDADDMILHCLLFPNNNEYLKRKHEYAGILVNRINKLGASLGKDTE